MGRFLGCCVSFYLSWVDVFTQEKSILSKILRSSYLDTRAHTINKVIHSCKTVQRYYDRLILPESLINVIPKQERFLAPSLNLSPRNNINITIAPCRDMGPKALKQYDTL